MEEKLPGDYVAGFVDGEGCFALKFRREVKNSRKNKREYFYWDIEFAILLNAKDREILEKIQATLDCGRIGKTDQHGSVRYSVNDINDLYNKVSPFFNRYQLHAIKRYDFLLWQEAIGLFMKNQRLRINVESGVSGFQKTVWDTKDLKRLGKIREEMKDFKGGNHSQWKWLDRKS